MDATLVRWSIAPHLTEILHAEDIFPFTAVQMDEPINFYNTIYETPEVCTNFQERKALENYDRP